MIPISWGGRKVTEGMLKVAKKKKQKPQGGGSPPIFLFISPADEGKHLIFVNSPQVTFEAMRLTPQYAF